ncbi:glycosyltransferase family 4 protein [Scleroderma citrinum Foug A]|uniref:GDP-Man:Man(3)GlcNAc(2)-PP-Dol alpha-1,2-mannosyltransferase n=1 Tax=Scleroderma citrinum Foug A TaxID=1036808 RepID=A0A0C3CX81_9AGAM|nr:glycosyltransferase family 4 protein [Scleroderma citrinum Foug A]
MGTTTVYVSFAGLSLLALVLAYVAYTESIWSRSLRNRRSILDTLGLDSTKYKFVGFFHPYWGRGRAVAHIQRQHKDIVCVVYTGDTDASKEDIIDNVQTRFAIRLDPSTVHFAYLRSRRLVENATWPRLTILGHSLGSMYLGWEAMCEFIPDLYMDTMGYAFTFPVVAWLTRAAVPIGAYVHYPTVSTDMLARVPSDSWTMRMKRMYYCIAMYYYALSLSNTRFLMVNSSWTRSHIASILSHEHFGVGVRCAHVLPPLTFIWCALSARAIRNIMFLLDGYRAAGAQTDEVVKPEIVYPPCDTRELATFSLEGRAQIILSVAQFRPEKDHQTQLPSFAQLLMDHPEYRSTVRLVLLGGARNQEDMERVSSLGALATELDVEKQVTFVVNASHSDVLKWLSCASIGLSTMVDEHFGINIVEFMAAGLISVTHASGGPLHDIVVPYRSEPTGFHAKTPGEFSAVMHQILTMDGVQERAYRERARRWAVERFSEDAFVRGWEKSGWRSLV